VRRRVWPFSRATTARISVVAAAAFIAAVPTGQSATRDAAVGAGGDDRMRPPTNVVQGDTVRFRWEDGGHDLVLTGPETTRVDGRQDRDFVLTRKLDRAGTYTMLCTLHDNMDATFTVAAAPGAPANEGREFDEVDVVVAPDGDTGVAPRDVTVEEGQTVLWHWGDDNQSVRFADGQGGSGTIGGTPYSRRFDTVGTYAYSGGGGSGTVNVVAPRGPGWLGIRKAAAGTTPNARITVGSGNSYSPTAVTIDEGGTVEWSWAGGFHNVKFEDGTKTEFKSSGTEAYTFYTPSATPLRFVCEAHSGMDGTVTVRDTGAPGPNTQAPAPDTGGGDTGGEAGGGLAPAGPSMAKV
jgi:plastocyanin